MPSRGPWTDRRPPERQPFDRRPPERRPEDQHPFDRRPPERSQPGRPFPGRPPQRPGQRPWTAAPANAAWPRPEPALPPPDSLGPDEELVAGRRPVEEAFAAGRPALRLLVVPQRRGPLEKLVLHATRLRIPIVELEGGSLTALAGFDGHQGVALVVEPRQFATLDDILARARERDEPPFVLVLDSLEDPQNVGTLLRSAEAAGVHGVVFPVRRQAPLTPAAVKASAGAVEHLLLCPVDDLGGALADLHGHGLRIAGSEADAPLTARQSDLRGPLAIVVGSEGQGLGPTVRRRCDMFMRIPMRGAVGSLNAAVAGSILLFEAVVQRDPEGRARTQPSAAWPIPRRAAVEPSGTVATDTSGVPESADPGLPAAAEAPTGTEVAPGAPAPTPESGEPEPVQREPASGPEPEPGPDRDQSAPDQEPEPEPETRRESEPEPELPDPDSTGPAAPAGPEPGAATDVSPAEASPPSDDDLLPGAAAPKASRPRRPRPPRG